MVLQSLFFKQNFIFLLSRIAGQLSKKDTLLVIVKSL